MANKLNLNLQQLAEDGRRLMKEGKPEQAQELFRQVLAQLPGGRPRARLSYRDKESQIVINRLSRRVEPLSPAENFGLEARLALANCCLECGQVEESIRQLEQAVEVCPDRADAYCELGLAYEKGGRAKLAVSALRRALRLDPGLYEVYHSLAQHYVRQERLFEAQKALRKALQLNPDQYDYYLGLASCYAQQRKLAKAIKWLQRAARKFPNVTVVREMLADFYQRVGDFCGLMEQARALIKLNPHNPLGYDLLSTAKLRCGDIDGALVSLRKLIRLNPMDALTRLKLALVLQQKGDLGRAMEQYQQVTAMTPGDEMGQAALEAMENLDQYQMQQILLRAAEDKFFRAQLERNTETTLNAHGYRLTEYALEALRRLEYDPEPPTEQWDITYH